MRMNAKVRIQSGTGSFLDPLGTSAQVTMISMTYDTQYWGKKIILLLFI